jgi:DNA replication and repair protein RecF
MSVVKLTTHNFRNLTTNSIALHPQLNFILGDNGSGKSSLLEAIFFIGHGKSFRTSKSEHLACYDTHEFIVSVNDNNGLQFGLSKNTDLGLTSIKINGERHSRLSDLAKNIAVQIVTPESFKLFFGGPKERRRFIDLGMFHVKHDFSKQWRDFSRVLKQRNACIRSLTEKSILDYWTNIFCELSIKVAMVRQEYVNGLIEELKIWLSILLPELVDKVTVQYSQGWSQSKSLSDVLLSNVERERNYGYSLYGAHKFDVKFLLGKQVIDTQLSRGQQKLFLLALTFAQAKLIAKVNRVKPILLIDDIGAELDTNSRLSLSKAINNLDCQVIITAIEESVLDPFLSSLLVTDTEDTNVDENGNYKMFHVKHGKVFEK